MNSIQTKQIFFYGSNITSFVNLKEESWNSYMFPPQDLHVAYLTDKSKLKVQVTKHKFLSYCDSKIKLLVRAVQYKTVLRTPMNLMWMTV